MFRKQQILNSKLFYDDKEDQFYSSKPDYKNGGYTKKELETEPGRFGEVVYEMALKRPGEWIGPRLGAPRDDEAPKALCTDVPMLYQQGKKLYCLAYSLASALRYCELHDQAQWVAESADPTSKKEFDDQLNDLLAAMKNFVPLIGSATRYGVRTNGHKREKRTLTWHDLFKTLTPYPTIVVPIRSSNGDYSHAFCVIDDLIFDSSTPFALIYTSGIGDSSQPAMVKSFISLLRRFFHASNTFAPSVTSSWSSIQASESFSLSLELDVSPIISFLFMSNKVFHEMSFVCFCTSSSKSLDLFRVVSILRT